MNKTEQLHCIPAICYEVQPVIFFLRPEGQTCVVDV